MPHTVEDQVAHRRLAAVEHVAGARVVDEASWIVRGMAEIGAVVEPAQRQRRAVRVALAGVVEHNVEEDADSGIMQGRNRLAQIGQPARRQPRVERHEGDRVVSPGIGQPERAEMALVDPGRDRHQLDSRYAEPGQMLEHGRMPQRRQPAALVLGNVGMAHGEGPHLQFVDQPAWPEQGRLALRDARRRPHDRLGHQRCGVDAFAARRGEPRIVDERPVDLDRIGIDQQLVGVEAKPPVGPVGSVGAQAVARAFRQACHEADVQPVEPTLQFDTGRFLVALVIEDADPNALGGARPDGKGDAIRLRNGAEPGGLFEDRRILHQVMTLGVTRPVRARIWAIASAETINGASACCAS